MQFMGASNQQVQIIQHLINRPGQIVTMETRREMRVRKNQRPVIKYSRFQCRVGVNYDNITAVQQARASGDLPAQNTGLPWGQWVLFPLLIQHGDEYYIRCTSLPGGHRWTSTYECDNQQITEQQARAMTLASEWGDRDSTVFNCRISSITSVV